MTSRLAKLILFNACLAVVLAPLVSCQRVYPVRTLPSWVRGIYIPMVQNVSTEPAVEETATVLMQEEFMADGRVGVVRKNEADLQLVAVIRSWRVLVEEEDNDDVPSQELVEMITSVKLYDPLVDPFELPEDPIADLGLITTEYRYNSDPRSTGYMIEPDMKEGALRLLARQIVNETITGFPVELKGDATGLTVPDQRSKSMGVQGDVFRNKSRFD